MTNFRFFLKNVTTTVVCFVVCMIFSGCDDKANPPQQATIMGDDSNVCPETTVILTAHAKDAVSFQWKKDAVVMNGQTASTLTVSESGIYTVAGVNEAGTGVFSAAKNVTVLACVPPPVASFTWEDNLEFFSLMSTSTGEISNYQWQVSGSQVVLSNPTAKETVLELPATATTVSVSLTVTNSGGSSTCTENIDLPPLTFCRQYGLGKYAEAERNNSVSYEWYIDQVNTGQHSYVNCGPACVTMAIKWSNQSFTKTAEDARKTYLPSGGWWYTNNITDYLTDNNTAHYISSLSEANALISQLDDGNIAILCLDMYYVSYHSGNPEWHIDKFYTTLSSDWGHFIVAKGYKIVDGIIWFEIYDPWSLNVRYDDGSLKGRDRYYRSEDIMQATNVWWQYMIVINHPEATAVRGAYADAIDPATIVHQRGR